MAGGLCSTISARDSWPKPVYVSLTYPRGPLNRQGPGAMMIRAFIAIIPPTTLQQSMAAIRQAFQRLSLPWRWVPPDHIHLTLRFLGTVPDESVLSLLQAIEQASQGQSAFPLRARALGCFPHPARPRVLWVGLDDPQKALGRLNERLIAALTPLGFPPEDRPFHPHLTLARAQNRSPSNQPFPMLQIYQNWDFGEFLVTSIHLMKSQIQRGGSRYTILRSVPLQD
jgi:2'-5' RNA ligase